MSYSVASQAHEPGHVVDRIVPLNFETIISSNNKVPESHVWSDSDYTPTYQQPASDESVPIINLSDPNAARLIGEACEKWGAFQAVGYGVPLSFLNEVEAETRRLFALPMEKKMLAVTKPGEYIGYSVPLMSKFYKTEVWSEGFTIRGSPENQVAKLWADGSECMKFGNVMDEFQKQMDIVAQKILSLMLTSLGLAETDVAWLKTINTGHKSKTVLPPSALRLNSYPVCPNPTQTMGMNPHTDTSIITLLYQGSIAGLQVQSKSGEWVNVPPVEGGVVVNLGDLTQIFTNGKFKSVMHRVVANGAQHRISLGYFYGPAMEAEIAPAEKLVEEAGKAPVYKSVTWEDYLSFKHTHGLKALEMTQI